MSFGEFDLVKSFRIDDRSLPLITEHVRIRTRTRNSGVYTPAADRELDDELSSDLDAKDTEESATDCLELETGPHTNVLGTDPVGDGATQECPGAEAGREEEQKNIGERTDVLTDEVLLSANLSTASLEESEEDQVAPQVATEEKSDLSLAEQGERLLTLANLALQELKKDFDMSEEV